ncbi:FecR family protein [Pedobacter psychrodurus]|uniref:FecR family protein n=1 Tax=Pedobacter psychrodurus TaxID=2530456 RepID=UPI00292ED6B3|nr:FecR domain-containing protein [Pedobacter psychrodurus]
MDNEQARALLKKYNSGQCTEDEQALIEQSFFAFNEQDIEVSFEKLKSIKKQIATELPKPEAKMSFLKISVAISTAAAIVAFAIYLFTPRYENNIDKSLEIAGKIFSKGNVAVITLSDGKTIELDKTKVGIMVDGSNIIYNDGSKITAANPTAYQSISTPKGGEYKIVLSDGTKVWLNAATVLQYPTSFRDRTERRVKLVSGEAYFEVAKDKDHPFIVASRNQDLTVLGTHFDVNTYESTVKTTLLEGSVKLNLNGKNDSLKLAPGEQSATSGTSFEKSEADLGINLAWRNGKIKFRNKDIKSILQEAERWYNIKVEYENGMPNIHLTGGISRKSSLATLLKLLQMSGIDFTMKEEQDIKVLIIRS